MVGQGQEPGPPFLRQLRLHLVGKQKSLVLVLSMNSEQLIKTNMITTRFALIINFQPAENDKILEHEAGAVFFRLKPT